MTEGQTPGPNPQQPPPPWSYPGVPPPSTWWPQPPSPPPPPWAPQPSPPWAPQPPAPWRPQPYPPLPLPLVAAVAPAPGGDFALAYPAVPPLRSGMAIGSLVVGIASIMVAFVVLCFGTTGAAEGWGPAVAGAFTVLAAVAGLAACALGWLAMRHIQQSAGMFVGRGTAIGGIGCGVGGAAMSIGALALALLLAA